MNPEEYPPGRQWPIKIEKVNGQWTIEKAGGRELPNGCIEKVSRGPNKKKHAHEIDNRCSDTVKWTLVPDPDAPEKRISAHFQFTDDLLENLPGRTGDLTRDWTAEILAPGGTLELKVKSDADRRRKPFHYAVWVRDETHLNGKGGEFAVGEAGNPPPEMEVGP